MKLINFLKDHKFTVSVSDGKRIVVCGAVRVNGEIITDFHRQLEVGDVVEFRNQRITCTPIVL